MFFPTKGLWGIILKSFLRYHIETKTNEMIIIFKGNTHHKNIFKEKNFDLRVKL